MLLAHCAFYLLACREQTSQRHLMDTSQRPGPRYREKESFAPPLAGRLAGRLAAGVRGFCILLSLCLPDESIVS